MLAKVETVGGKLCLALSLDYVQGEKWKQRSSKPKKQGRLWLDFTYAIPMPNT